MSRSNPLTTHDYAGIAAWKFELKAEIHSYRDALDFLGGDIHGPVEAELGPKMRVKLREAPDLHSLCAAVVLYDTEIIRYYPDGSFSVDNGGFNTPTTSTRLNAVLPEGFTAFHKDKKIALMVHGSGERLYALDHSRRILPTTITTVEA